MLIKLGVISRTRGGHTVDSGPCVQHCGEHTSEKCVYRVNHCALPPHTMLQKMWPQNMLVPMCTWLCAALHNVYIGQYIYLATEQSETYRKSCILIYLLTYICPSSFDCEVNTYFWIFVKSNSKSQRFSLVLIPNNFGTGQKKAYFLGMLEN